MSKAVAMFPTPICTVCGKLSVVEIPVEKLSDVVRWRARKDRNIQEILPDLTADDRELLISGTHPACWDELFGKEEDDEEAVP